MVAWTTADHLRTDLIADALKAACDQRRPIRPLVFHSAHEFGVLLSAGRTGQCWDNALTEFSFATIKRELLGTAAWPAGQPPALRSSTSSRDPVAQLGEAWAILLRTYSAAARLWSAALSRGVRRQAAGRGGGVSMRSGPGPEVPEATREVALAAFPKRCLAIRVRDELGPLFDDEVFRSAFGVRGRPGVSPGQLALVSVMQFAENLTDRQAAHAVRARIDWKYLLGAELTDPGFDFTVLTGFRDRLLAHGLEERILDLLLQRLAELGLVAPGAGSAPTPRTSWPP